MGPQRVEDRQQKYDGRSVVQVQLLQGHTHTHSTYHNTCQVWLNVA